MSEVVVDTNIGDKTNFREQIKSYFNKKLHVIVTDGRIIIGSFQVIYIYRNIYFPLCLHMSMK